jgi:aryl-alcohol dehydrogenase-like predicted oxidoreductase
MATPEATHAYRERHADRGFARTYFRRAGDCAVSSVGLGTYLGDPTPAGDSALREALTCGLEHGVNVVDTASNYRCGRSERVVGEALDRADVDRESVVVATKGGFVPFDGERPDDPGAFVRREYVDPGLVAPSDLASGQHALTPGFLDDQLDRSLAALDVAAVDRYFVHNPEVQLATRSREAVYDLLEDAFAVLEERVARGDVRGYGVATWDAFRVPPDHDRYLSLREVVSRARRAAERAGADATHLRAIQLPFSVSMADAFTVAAHEGADGVQSALWYAREAGLEVYASAALAGGDLADGLPQSVAAQVGGDTPAQRALNFARSAPGVTSALVGSADVAHVRENVAAGTFEPLGSDAFDAVFE